MAAWANTFRVHKHIKKVKMVQNGIRQEGISLLLRDGLRGCAELQVLDLQDNTFTFVGSQALSEVVGGWTQLEELGIGDCLLGARGSVIVAEALAKGANPRLRVLRAQYNDINDQGVDALMKATKHGLGGLRRVEINGNKFPEDDPAIEQLRSLLEERRDNAAEEEDDKNAGEWGLDDLSDLEEESDNDDDDDDDNDDDNDKPEQIDSEEETDLKAETILKEAHLAPESTAVMPQEEDEDVDRLTEKLEKTRV